MVNCRYFKHRSIFYIFLFFWLRLSEKWWKCCSGVLGLPCTAMISFFSFCLFFKPGKKLRSKILMYICYKTIRYGSLIFWREFPQFWVARNLKLLFCGVEKTFLNLCLSCCWSTFFPKLFHNIHALTLKD